MIWVMSSFVGCKQLCRVDRDQVRVALEFSRAKWPMSIRVQTIYDLLMSGF